MTGKSLPNVDYLRNRLDYDPETGNLFWAERQPDSFLLGCEDPRASKWRERDCYYWNERFAGKAAGSGHIGGYASVTLEKVQYRAHRIIWKMVYGENPDFIDHINGDVTDNRISNLRNVSALQNAQNAKRPDNNVSGVVGVTQTPSGKWSAYIGYKNKRVDLGSYDDKEQAIAVRAKAEEICGFHENHGRDSVENFRKKRRVRTVQQNERIMGRMFYRKQKVVVPVPDKGTEGGKKVSRRRKRVKQAA